MKVFEKIKYRGLEYSESVILGGYPLVLTGTIDSNVYGNIGNKIRDVSERLRQHESAIARYILESPFDPIIFIENSGYLFNAKKFLVLANREGKQFEFISGKICFEEIRERGKSFGDAYLIHEVLKKSKLLKNKTFFYKITGRIFLKNSYQIVKTRDKYRNEFICYTGAGWCLTNIFKANKEDYLKYLDTIYEDCNENKTKDIEISFYYRLLKASMEVGSFEVYPWFEGIQGATLKSYSGGFLERCIRNILAKLHVFKLNSVSSKLIGVMIKIKKIKIY
ncbi:MULTISPECIES: hypothetical protein [Blautia]|uniref:hypothetical protein n=1 Tax=Blautia TaxID=572511 RepID=UPI001D06711F|nr:hypothetical protein [Blautia marasmi]MCB6194758.1 hypothetical protein [Blautia marasmi]